MNAAHRPTPVLNIYYRLAGMRPSEVTDNQVLEHIRRLTKEQKGRPPSYLEIGAACGASGAWAHHAVHRLALAGLLTYIPNEPRSIRIVERRRPRRS